METDICNGYFCCYSEKIISELLSLFTGNFKEVLFSANIDLCEIFAFYLKKDHQFLWNKIKTLLFKSIKTRECIFCHKKYQKTPPPKNLTKYPMSFFVRINIKWPSFSCTVSVALHPLATCRSIFPGNKSVKLV